MKNAPALVFSFWLGLALSVSGCSRSHDAPGLDGDDGSGGSGGPEASGGDRRQAGSGGEGGAHAGEGDTGGSGNSAGSTGGGTPVYPGGDGGMSGGAERCGDGIVQASEECDDGNLNDMDGCTVLCKFTCTEGVDCNDLNLCNGEETCLVRQHTCIAGHDLADGEPCGQTGFCWRGLCVDDCCGDGVQPSYEECDDGNLVVDDGCTPNCEFTCVSTDASRDCSGGDECAGDPTCDDAAHVCQGAVALPDEEPCYSDGGSGWCMSGACVVVGCGDGVKAGGEQCDSGQDNGKPGSGCSIDCTTSLCGNGEIEGDEQCDDGNQETLDGCDADCKWEHVHRITRLDLRDGYAPGFCLRRANRLGEAFPRAVEVFPGSELDALESMNHTFNQPIDTGDSNLLLHVIDSSDSSLRTRDADITIGIYRGIRAKAWEQGPPLDYPFLVTADSVEADHRPARYHSIEAEQGGCGRVASKTAAVVETDTLFRHIHDFKMRVIFDVSMMSTPSGPPLPAGSLPLPETHGMDDPGVDPYRPRGVMCGAVSRDSLDEIPVDPFLTNVCCQQNGVRYRACEDGAVSGQCHSMLDMFENGCWLCLVVTDPTGPSDCERVARGECVPLFEPIPCDVDTDGDGENDAWSAVFAFEGKRVRIRGVAE